LRGDLRNDRNERNDRDERNDPRNEGLNRRSERPGLPSGSTWQPPDRYAEAYLEDELDNDLDEDLGDLDLEDLDELDHLNHRANYDDPYPSSDQNPRNDRTSESGTHSDSEFGDGTLVERSQ
jgi:hypothetical protein